MKLIKFTKSIAFFALVAGLITSCEKVKTPTPLEDAGQTIVKLVDGGQPGNRQYAIDFVATPTTLTVADIRRDVSNNAELNRTMNVTIIDDTAALRAYGIANNISLIYLPANFYTIKPTTPKTGGIGGVFNVVLNPGEFAKPIEIIIPDATVLNPSSKYGLAFTITAADANGIISSAKTIVVEIGAKNDWDGIYEITGVFTDLANPAFVSDYPQEYALVTTGATTCDVININLNGGIPGFSFSNAGTPTFFGAYGYVIGFDPSSGVINTFHNYYGDRTKAATGGGDPAAGTGPPLYASSNGRRAVLDPTGVNAAQSNKDIIIKHWLIQPAAVAVGPRATFNETWRYVGPR